ncbi:MAG: patatin-like phospholipase family protein [Elusimicrobia bacterium]|nr:patatin-like phospholipase family protein [Elusimicrobiota bacterium]
MKTKACEIISNSSKKQPFVVSIFISCLILLAFIGVSFSAEISDDDILTDILWSKVINLNPPDRPSVGIALSGGGARGFAHVGVLDVLSSSGFPIDYIAGTSMGAVVGALYSSDMKMEDIWNFGRETASRKISKDFKGFKAINLLFRDKLISPKYITDFIEKSLGAYTFESLKYPFACVAMDFTTGEKIVFNSGPVDIAVMASANLPGIFKPIKYRHRYLVDGGVVDFLPVDVAKLLGAQWILASITESAPEVLPENVLFSLMQVIDIRGSLLSKQAQDEADFVLKPFVGVIKTADFNKCIEAGEIGVIETNSKLKKLKRAYLIDAVHLIMRKF